MWRSVLKHIYTPVFYKGPVNSFLTKPKTHMHFHWLQSLQLKYCRWEGTIIDPASRDFCRDKANILETQQKHQAGKSPFQDALWGPGDQNTLKSQRYHRHRAVYKPQILKSEISSDLETFAAALSPATHSSSEDTTSTVFQQDPQCY